MKKPYVDLVTPPACEPLTVIEVREALGIEAHDVSQDHFITKLIVDARQMAEDYLRRSLVTQTWQLQYDQYVPHKVLLPKGPAQSITSVKIISQDWSENNLDPKAYWIHSAKDMLYFDAVPMGKIVQIHYVTGYGMPEEVPENIRQGLLVHVAMAYQGHNSDGGLPLMVADLYEPYKKVSV